MSTRPRALVVGDLCWDRVFYLSAPLESGGRQEVLSVDERPGGSAGNIARALAGVGVEVDLVSAVGADDAGRMLLADLEKRGMRKAHVQLREEATRACTVLVEPDGERTMVISPGTRPAVPAGRGLAGYDVAFFGRQAREWKPFAEMLEQQGMPIWSSWSKRMVEGFPASIVIESGRELPAGPLGPDEHDEDRLMAAFLALRKQTGGRLRTLIVTHGTGGASWVQAESVHHLPAQDAEPVDATGAGDAFAAGVLTAMLRGAALERALHLGLAWGAKALESLSSVPPAWDEVVSSGADR